MYSFIRIAMSVHCKSMETTETKNYNVYIIRRNPNKESIRAMIFTVRENEDVFAVEFN